MKHLWLTLLLTLPLACSDVLGIGDFAAEEGDPPTGDDRDGAGGAGGVDRGPGPATAVWVRTFGGEGDDAATAFAAAGEAFVVAGLIEGQVAFDDDLVGVSAGRTPFLLWIDGQGSVVQTLGAAQPTPAVISALGADDAGNLVAGGTYSGDGFSLGDATFAGATGADGFVASFNPMGTLRWQLTLSGASDDRVEHVDVDASGRTLVVGSFAGSITIAGTTLGATADVDAFAALVDADGDLIWARAFGEAGDQRAMRGRLVDGGAIIAGTFRGTLPLDESLSASGIDAFVARLDASGMPVASRRFGNGGAHEVGDLVVGDALLMGGAYRGQSIFSADEVVDSNGDALDGFVVTLDPVDLSTRDAATFGGTGAEHVRAVAPGGAEGFFWAGSSSSDPIVVGGELMPNHGNGDALLAMPVEGDEQQLLHFGRHGPDAIEGLAFAGSDLILAATVAGRFELGGVVEAPGVLGNVVVTRVTP